MTLIVNKTTLLVGIIGILIVVSMIVNLYQSDNQTEPVLSTNVTAQSDIDHSQPVNKETSYQSLQAELQRLRIDLASERSLVKKQKAKIQRLLAQLAEFDADTPTDKIATDESVEIMQADETEKQALADENMVMLDQALSKEIPDPVWSAMATASIHEMLDSEALTGSKLIDTNCAATLCRVEALQKGPEASELFIDQLMFGMAWGGSTFAKVINHAGDGQTVVYYVSRNGFQLPLSES